jgi:hypothetical protein
VTVTTHIDRSFGPLKSAPPAPPNRLTPLRHTHPYIDRPIDGSIDPTNRMDGCVPMAYPKFAVAKAMTCISLCMSSRRFRDKYTAAKVV